MGAVGCDFSSSGCVVAHLDVWGRQGHITHENLQKKRAPLTKNKYEEVVVSRDGTTEDLVGDGVS